MPFSLSFLCVLSELCGEKSLHLWRHLRISPQRRITPPHPPHLRQPGGASRLSRRLLRHKILTLAALPVLPADNLGGNFANSANFNANRNIQAPKTRPLLTFNF
jgi:hypothetical protein